MRASTRARVLIACVVGALVATACIPRDTTQITLDEERVVSQSGQSWEVDYYVNDAYECGLSGNYSFMVMNPGGNPDAEAPLWVYLHGGGQGYWDENGDYQGLTFQDEDSWNHQESLDGLIDGVQARVLDGNGQPEDQTLVRRIQEGYRLLVVSYCDHDFYSGLGTPYPNHPTNPNAQVNGLQATMAAIDYTAANYPTTHVWAHGTSAGGPGVWSLASSYGFEGTPLTGVVADSGAVTPGLLDIFDEYLLSGDLNYMPTWEPEGLAEKVGFFANEAIPAYPEAQIVDRDFRAVPSLFIIGSVDPFCAGDLAPVPEAAAGLTNCEHAYGGLDQAIANQTDSPHEIHFLPNTGHVPTHDPGPANDIVDDFIAEVLATNPPTFAGPTPDEPFHMPTMTDASTLDVVVLEDWHVDSVTGTNRQKLIEIHVDEWWEGVEIRVPVRLIAPLTGTVDGFVINGASLPDTGDAGVTAAEQAALGGGVGVVQTKIKPIQQYPGFPSEATLGARFLEDLDLRYTEVYMWGAIMMRSITAAFDDPVFGPGPVIAYGGSKNGITPLVSAIHDERVTAVRANVAFTANTPIRANDTAAVAEVIAADVEFDAAVAAGLPAGDQPWSFYDKAYQGGGNIAQAAQAAGWSDADIQNAIDRVADDIYVSENWDELAARGVDIFSLPGSHDWVAYDVPGVGTILPDLRTYIVPNGGHSRPGHPEAPSDSVDAAFFAEQLFGADPGLATPDIATTINGTDLDVTVTFPDGGVPEDSRIFWMYDRGPDGSSWYLYDLFPEDNWTTMTGAGSTWTASIPLESGPATIDLVTTHTVTVDGHVVPISAPYTRVAF